MSTSTEDDVATLRDLCAQCSELTTVTRVDDGQPEWVFEDGLLKNTRAEYFSISLRQSDSGQGLLMMEQWEPALIVLLVADIDGVESVLLSLRTEPGLIGLTNYSATIQSTASNYLRKHGGKPTPFIEVADDPRSFGAVLYDAEQFDWGHYYVHKTKRFLIVRLSERVPATPGHRWVSLRAARQLLLENHLITNDLRVALNHILRPARIPELVGEATPSTPDRSALPTSPRLSPAVMDSRGVGLAFFRTDTETREVNSWVQPLLVPSTTMNISFPYFDSGSEKFFGVEKRTQPGLLGRRVWFPATVPGPATLSVATSAEGGRFWRHSIDIGLQRVGTPSERASGNVEWLTETEVADLVAAPLQTSLELRMAWSVAAAESPDVGSQRR
jgi:hypothetical protein